MTLKAPLPLVVGIQGTSVFRISDRPAQVYTISVDKQKLARVTDCNDDDDSDTADGGGGGDEGSDSVMFRLTANFAPRPYHLWRFHYTGGKYNLPQLIQAY